MLAILLRMAITLAHELVPDATTISTPPWPPLPPPLGAQSEWKEGRWMRKEEQRQLDANKQILFFDDMGRRFSGVHLFGPIGFVLKAVPCLNPNRLSLVT